MKMYHDLMSDTKSKTADVSLRIVGIQTERPHKLAMAATATVVLTPNPISSLKEKLASHRLDDHGLRSKSKKIGSG